MINATLIADLRTRNGTIGANVLTLGRTTAGDGMGGIFYWDDVDATTADDGFNTIQITGQAIGRWKRVLSPGNVSKSGSWTGSGVLGQFSYVIPHTLGMTPNSVQIQATTPASSGACYVSAATASNFTITFLAVPGTNNQGFYWTVSV